jgi:hypothetical protein
VAMRKERTPVRLSSCVQGLACCCQRARLRHLPVGPVPCWQPPLMLVGRGLAQRRSTGLWCRTWRNSSAPLIFSCFRPTTRHPDHLPALPRSKDRAAASTPPLLAHALRMRIHPHLPAFLVTRNPAPPSHAGQCSRVL